MMSPLFHGSAVCDLDPDGGFAVPDLVGKALEHGELLVARHDAEPCLVGYDCGRLETLAERGERRRLIGEERGEDVRDHYRRMRSSFGPVARMERAGARLRIPPALRHLGRIGRRALFVGTGDCFEIWSPELALQSDDPQFRDLAAFHLGTHDAQGVH